jgi:hypothetical protein
MVEFVGFCCKNGINDSPKTDIIIYMSTRTLTFNTVIRPFVSVYKIMSSYLKRWRMSEHFCLSLKEAVGSVTDYGTGQRRVLLRQNIH